MPSNHINDEVVQNFLWKFTSQEDADLFNQFRLLLLTQSCSVELRLMKWIREIVQNNPLPFTIVLESTAVVKLREDGLETTRMTLKKYRDKGVLVNGDGKPFWFTDGFTIGYNYEKLKEFVAKRKEAGVEPLVQNENT